MIPVTTVGTIYGMNEWQDTFEVLADREDKTVSLSNIHKDEGIVLDAVQIDNLIALLTLAKKEMI